MGADLGSKNASGKTPINTKPVRLKYLSEEDSEQVECKIISILEVAEEVKLDQVIQGWRLQNIRFTPSL